MNIDNLLVHKPNGKKERIGRANDGGYVIITDENDTEKYDLFLSAGINDDVSFENALLEKYPYLEKCLAFDGSISDLPKDANPKIEFVKKNICGLIATPSDTSVTNLHKEMEGYKNIFLKIDIEEAEFAFFHFLSREQMMQFKDIVVEFHFPFTQEKWDILGKIKETHWLVHHHGNNSCGTVIFDLSNGGKVEIPRVFEVCYIRKKDGITLELSDDPIPSAIDQRNVVEKEEIILSGYPYNILKQEL
jgi:hypothetical protein